MMIVIIREGGMIQYSAPSQFDPMRRRLLDVRLRGHDGVNSSFGLPLVVNNGERWHPCPPAIRQEPLD